MARFKLVKISKRRVEVQKVRLKVRLGILLVAFACAFLVWLYVKGSRLPMPLPPEESQPQETVTTQAETTPEVATNPQEGSVTAEMDVSSLLPDDGGCACEA